MAAPILWAPGKCALSAGKPMSIKFLVLGGRGVFLCFFFGGGSADFIFMGARIFLNEIEEESKVQIFLRVRVGDFQEFVGPARKASKTSGKFRSIFRKKFRNSHNSEGNFILERCHPNNPIRVDFCSGPECQNFEFRIKQHCRSCCFCS